METPCLCPSEGHKHGGRKVTETCHPVLLFKRRIIALKLRHIERNVSSSASTVQLAKTKVMTYLLTSRQPSRVAIFMSHNAKAWKFNVLYYNKKNPVELKHCETSSSYRVFYLMKLKLCEGKVIFNFGI